MFERVGETEIIIIIIILRSFHCQILIYFDSRILELLSGIQERSLIESI